MIWESLGKVPKLNASQNILVIYGTGNSTEAGWMAEWLSPGEQERASRIRSEVERNTWISCHMVLRQVLGEMAGIKPSDIKIGKTPFGKLYLPGSNLQFNLSHTDKSFLLGFNFNGKIGIDLEYFTGKEELPLLIEHAFSPQETNFCFQGNTIENFLKIWTMKEAYLKATGVGLVDDLKSINIYGNEENDIVRNKLCQDNFICPNGETASIVYNNGKPIDYIWLK